MYIHSGPPQVQQSCSSGKVLTCLNSHSEAKTPTQLLSVLLWKKTNSGQKKKKYYWCQELPKGGENKSFIGSLKDHYITAVQTCIMYYFLSTYYQIECNAMVKSKPNVPSLRDMPTIKLLKVVTLAFHSYSYRTMFFTKSKIRINLFAVL